MNDVKVKMMKVVLVEAGRTARVAEIDESLEGMQKIVGGLIQCLPYKGGLIICNDEGKLMNLPLNRALYNEEGNIFDIISGTFFVCKEDEYGDGFSSLDEDEIEYYKHLFYYPEIVTVNKDGIMVTAIGNQQKTFSVPLYGSDDNRTTMRIFVERYALTGGIHLAAFNYDEKNECWELYDDITTCLPIRKYDSDVIFLNDGPKNGVDWNWVLKNYGVISGRKGTERSGYNRYNRYKVNMNELRNVCGDEQMEHFFSEKALVEVQANE